MFNQKLKLKSILLNFGPQHPAAHGILKIGLLLSGEVILRADPQFGLLHRGSEKLIETKQINQAIPYLDRMDYVANLFQEHAFVNSVENLNIKKIISKNILIWRTILDEFSRILNHLLTMGAICLDMGSMGPIFWAFEEREQIMEFYERISGARMHTALYKPFKINGLFFNKKLINDIIFLISRGSRFVSGSFISLLSNKSLKTRLNNVGIFSKNKIKNYGITGIIARASGVNTDLRLNIKNITNNTYSWVYFKSFLGNKGDSLDRFIVRSREIIESFKIINQLLLYVKPYFFNKKKNTLIKKNMEKTILSFKENIQNNFDELSNKKVSLSLLESPKGELSVILVSNKNKHLYRCLIKSPVAHNMNLIKTFSNKTTFADFVATFCSLDIVMGELDR